MPKHPDRQQRPRRPKQAHGQPEGNQPSGGRGASANRQSGGRQPDARRIAYDVLRAVAERDAYANLLLPAILRDNAGAIARRDAALATELSYGTLRGLGCYDEILRACSDRPLERIDPPLLDVLRLGTHQLLATRIPVHAAVGETVGLARTVVGSGLARFANAVLRKVATRDLAGWVEIVAPTMDSDPTGHLAIAYSHPRWMVTALADALRGDMERTRAVLAAHNEAARVTLAAFPGRCEPDELIAAGGSRAAYSRFGVHLAEGDPGGVTAVREGRAGVQDEGSQLVALALADAGLDGPDAAWLDLCAGPGGKAALLGGLAGDRGAQLLAVDQREHRAQLVRDTVSEDVGVAVADGTAPAWQLDRFDRVLVDVPCSGLGALRRRPELRWRREPRDIAALRPLQRSLLASALDSVRPGGLVAYATCSPHVAETTVVVDDVVNHRGDVERVDARASLAGVPDLGDGPYVQLWPDQHGTDAMFLALLRKTPAGLD